MFSQPAGGFQQKLPTRLRNAAEPSIFQQMTADQMERAIEFLLEHHTRFSGELDSLKETVTDLKEAVTGLVESTSSLERQAQSDRHEIREAIENLIVANEVTRDLAEKVAVLQIQMSHV
jgi:hypothetical protein